jgi:predicted O-methyltransferase YrrM
VANDDNRQANPFLTFAGPGHFYSPIPDLDAVDRYGAVLFDPTVTDIPGIDLQTQSQVALLESFRTYQPDMPFTDEPTPGLRYYFSNPYFSYGDAIVLYSMLRHRQPRRIVEIGSGFSSAIMLDTNDRFCDRNITMTFIDPFPQRLLSLLTEDDLSRHEVVSDVVQTVPMERFTSLGPDDVLFIDSSHVAKVGSDVVHLVTSVLPRLRTGVRVHFHDVFWPFEYPEAWIREGRAWNEDYLLKAFLQFNVAFKILLFNSYLAEHHRPTAERHLPLFMKNPGGGLWIEKTA